MKEARLQITEGMRRILDYPRFAGPTRLLILETKYFFDQSWRRAAEELGWAVASVSSVMTGSLTRDQVRDLFVAVGEHKPDFILTSNYAGMDTEGMFSKFFEDARIPYVSWFTDTPRMILYDRTVHCSPYSVAATWERAYIPHFQELGFEHVLYMPHATDPTLFRGNFSLESERNLAFVGVSMIELAAEAWEKLDESVPDVAKAIRDAFAQGRVTREAFAQGVETIIDPSVLAQCDKRDRRHVELCLVYEATKLQRCALAQRLVPYGIEVRGDADWAQVLERCEGQVGYFDDLAPFYRNTAVNLNTTSLQMKTAVNQRVFDCPAAGGFLITDAQADLEELFDPDSEVVTYGSLDELEDKIRHYLDRPGERQKIVQNAQRRIAARHTHRHRLESLECYLKNLFGA